MSWIHQPSNALWNEEFLVEDRGLQIVMLGEDSEFEPILAMSFFRFAAQFLQLGRSGQMKDLSLSDTERTMVMFRWAALW